MAKKKEKNRHQKGNFHIVGILDILAIILTITPKSVIITSFYSGKNAESDSVTGL